MSGGEEKKGLEAVEEGGLASADKKNVHGAVDGEVDVVAGK